MNIVSAEGVIFPTVAAEGVSEEISKEYANAEYGTCEKG